MSQSFTSVDREKIQKAFALAHRASQVQHRSWPRDKFREIARLIWEAHGEPGELPADIGNLLTKIECAEAQRGGYQPTTPLTTQPPQGGSGLGAVDPSQDIRSATYARTHAGDEDRP